MTNVLTEEKLKSFESKLRNYWSSNETNAGMTDSIIQICEELISSYRWISREYISVKDDYDSLIAIMDRARKLAYLAAEEDEIEQQLKLTDDSGIKMNFEEWKEKNYGVNYHCDYDENGVCDGTCDGCLYGDYSEYLKE